MCFVLIPVLPAEKLADGSGFSERDAATLFHCSPFHSPEIRILPAYMAMSDIFALNRQGWRNTAHPWNFSDASGHSCPQRKATRIF